MGWWDFKENRILEIRLRFIFCLYCVFQNAAPSAYQR